MMGWEFNHARESIMNGIYVTWISDNAKEDCFRIGTNSKCFCGHLFKDHQKILTKTQQKNNCTTCDCKAFSFIPRRPEEIGQGHLPRRKGFDINTWRASCVCKHTHEEHSAVGPHKCATCGCYDFQSDFCCISCDRKYESHVTLWETEKERQMAGKKIREAYLPLSDNPDI